MSADKDALIKEMKEDIAKYEAKIKELEKLVKHLEGIRARL